MQESGQRCLCSALCSVPKWCWCLCRYDRLLGDRNALEVAYEERLRAAEEKHAAQLDALDGQYQQKLIAEMERYQDLQKEREAAAAKWEAQAAALVDQHGRVVAEVSAGYERRLEVERERAAAVEEEQAVAEREWREVRRQLDEDVDREVETVKDRWVMGRQGGWGGSSGLEWVGGEYGRLAVGVPMSFRSDMHCLLGRGLSAGTGDTVSTAEAL